MDVYCPKCSEPFDLDEFHDIADEQDSTYAKVTAAFRLNGCEAIGSRHGNMEPQRDKTYDLTPAEASSALYDLLGDDMDGAAAMLDDMGF